MQLWILFALGSALSQVLRNMVMKNLGHALDENINVWGRFTFVLPFTGIAAAWRGLPQLGDGFWELCFVFGISQNISTLSLSRALKFSDISLVTTLWKLSVFFLVFWGFFTMGERPTPAGLLGILISVAGVYLLNASRGQISPLAPLLALLRDRGQLYTLSAAFFFAPTVILIKKIALLSDPVYGNFIAYVFASAMLTPFAVWRSGRHFRSVPRLWKGFFALGLLASISTVLGTSAYTMTLSSYVEAVKQVEILFALVIGYFVFGERERVRAIWPGCLLMLAGLVLLKVWG